MRILIADTDPKRTAELAQFLAATPAYEVMSIDPLAPGSFEALRGAGLVDLLLSSSAIPARNNSLLIHWARGANPHAEVLMFGPECDSHRSQAIALGATEYIAHGRLREELQRRAETGRLPRATTTSSLAIPSPAMPSAATNDPRDPKLSPGMRLGHYTILEHLATGGMGAIYKAFEPSLQREVAIKVLRPDFSQNGEYATMFEEEARAIAAIRHPHIVPIYYIGRDHNLLFFSMALIDGQDCQKLLNSSGRFTPERVRQIAREAVSALAAAWRHQIIHRDIKPSNLMVERDSNRVLLTDFGLARCLAHAADTQDAASGWGSPGYVAPEQVRQQATDQRSDIYSLGATFFHMLTGHTPYETEKPEDEIRKHLEAPFPYETAVRYRMPPGWVVILERMMAKEMADRFQDYDELATAIDHVDEMADYRPTEKITVMPVAQRPEWRADLLNGLLLPGTRDLTRFTENFGADINAQKILTAREFATLDRFTDSLRDLAAGAPGRAKDLLDFSDAVPEFTNYLVDLASSPWYAQAGPLESIEDALHRVGLVQAQALALIVLFVRDSRGAGKYFDWTPLWQHGIACGILTDHIIAFFGQRPTGYEVAAGFLHDIGKVVLSDIVPMAVLGALLESFEKQIDLATRERQAMGLDHAAAGAVWAQKVRFPGLVVEAIADHHTPGRLKKAWVLPAAVNLANHLCKRFGLGYGGNAILDTPRLQEQEGLALLFQNSARPDLDFALFEDQIVSRVPHLPIFRLG